MEKEMRELLYDVLTGSPPIDLHMATAVEDYDLPYGAWNPYVEQAMDIYSRYPGMSSEIATKMVNKLVSDHYREVVMYGKSLLVG
jgi:hypothetical protein